MKLQVRGSQAPCLPAQVDPPPPASAPTPTLLDTSPPPHLVSQKGVWDVEEGLAPRVQLLQRDAKHVAGREGDGGAGGESKT